MILRSYHIEYLLNFACLETHVHRWRLLRLRRAGVGMIAQSILFSDVLHVVPIADYTRGQETEDVRKLCNEGRMEEALQVVDLMDQQGVPISRDAVYYLLQACSRRKDLAKIRQVRSLMVTQGLDSVAVLGDHLIRLFASCGSLLEAKEVFNRISKPSIHTWNAIIAAHLELGGGQMAIDLFYQMLQADAEPDKVTFLYVLKACVSIRDVGQGKLIHDQIAGTGLGVDVVIGSTIIDMYAKCGSLDEARKVFDALSNRNEVSWGAMIAGYVQHGYAVNAFDLFQKLQQEGLQPSKVVFSCILRACGSIRAVNLARLIHKQIIGSGLESDVVIGGTLVDMYARCERVEEARQLFDNLLHQDLVSFGAMIAGYVQNGDALLALQLFENLQAQGILPDAVIFSSILKACGMMGVIWHGRRIHDQIVKRGLESHAIVGNALVDIYAKYGNQEDAHKVFDELPNQNVVSWGAVIAAYVQDGCGLSALELFEKMQQDSIKPDKVILLCLLKACAGIGAIGKGRAIHEQIIKSGLEFDLLMGNNLVDMYAKCGHLGEAYRVFEGLPQRDVVSWTTMFAGYALNGHFFLARQCFKNMEQRDLKPDHMIFTSILALCCQAGLLEEGCHYFNLMREEYAITPSVEHYSCIIDLLGRAGYLAEAGDLLLSIPMSPDAVCWRSLLNGCRTHKNLELGKQCFNRVVDLNPNDAAAYMTMSNIYAEAHVWKDVDWLEEFRKNVVGLKIPGQTWIEVNNNVHEFLVGGQSHQHVDQVHATSKRLNNLVIREGYVPQLHLVFV